MVRKHANLAKDEELNEAGWVAARGACVGAAKWGIFSAAAGLVAWRFSPIYRGLTFQFKVFLQMSGMALGSMIEADKRLRQHERNVRAQRQMIRDAAVWDSYFAETAREVEREQQQQPQQQQQQQQAGAGGSRGQGKQTR